MKVLVTGATTPLGRGLLEQLARAPDVDVVLATGREPTVGLPPRVQFFAADLTRSRDVHDLVWNAARNHGVDTVVHLAHHRDACETGSKVHAQNVGAARELVLRCAEHPTMRRFVYRSFAEVYALEHATSELLDEDAALSFAPYVPAWLRDRIEADLTVCCHLNGPLQIAVLRCAEIVAPHSGSQLWDYLSSRLCLRPLGFDPMLNLLSLEDAVAALVAAARTTATGVFNIPGADTLPLSKAIAESSRVDVAVPGPLLAPLYALRRKVVGFGFRYDLNRERFHIGSMLDGARARQQLGYVPHHPVKWPRPWWRDLFDQLAALSPQGK
jgi:UDP-glucose 4-epimerase